MAENVSKSNVLDAIRVLPENGGRDQSDTNPVYIYTPLPEGRIRRETLTIGGKTREQLQTELLKGGFQVSSSAQDMLKSQDFVTLKTVQDIDLVWLTVADLGFNLPTTTRDIYKRAQEKFGLKRCPAEVGPYLRLKDTNQKMGEQYYIAMKPIADRHGDPNIFGLVRNAGGKWLEGYWTEPSYEWDPSYELVFTYSPQAILKS